MASAPDTLTLGRNRDRRGHAGPWARRAGLALLAIVPLCALLNVFGQRPETSTAATARARLEVHAPASRAQHATRAPHYRRLNGGSTRQRDRDHRRNQMGCTRNRRKDQL